MESQKRVVRNGRILGSVADKGGCNAPIQNARIRIYGPFTPETEEPAREGPSRRGQAHGGQQPSPAPYEPPPGMEPSSETHSDDQGDFYIEDVKPGKYYVCCDAFQEVAPACVEVKPGCLAEACFQIPIDFGVSSHVFTQECGEAVPCSQVYEGTSVLCRADYDKQTVLRPVTVTFEADQGRIIEGPSDDMCEAFLLTDGTFGRVTYRAVLKEVGSAQTSATSRVMVLPQAGRGVAAASGGGVGVTLRRTAVAPTVDQPLWVAIRNRTRAISFNGSGSGSGYRDFVDRVFNVQDVPDRTEPGLPDIKQKRFAYGTAGYDLLRTATEIFLLLEAGVVINNAGALDQDRFPPINKPVVDLFSPTDEAARLGTPTRGLLERLKEELKAYFRNDRLPYIERVVNTAFSGDALITNPFGFGLLRTRVEAPLLVELIWSYWHEEGMLVQTMNAISRRFQNVHSPGERDPLAHFELDPLRPLNNLLWGYIQDEQDRLSVQRRAYEYQHEYGITVFGKAVPQIRAADVRSKFLEGFHNLLHACATFFKEDNDTTVIADAYPLLNALKEVHMILAQGAHNQFGDLPFTARAEMLMQEWLLARPEMRDFLQSRAMVPYKEAWMPQVDTMKTLQGWTDVTVSHFRDLGVFGEQILLSIRYGDWIDIDNEDAAKNWARYWRSEIHGYIHAYRAVTGVDLTNPDSVDATMPAVHLQRRLPRRAQPAPQAIPMAAAPQAIPMAATPQAIPAARLALRPS